MDNLMKTQKTVTIDETIAMETITMDTVIIVSQDVGVSTSLKYISTNSINGVFEY